MSLHPCLFRIFPLLVCISFFTIINQSIAQIDPPARDDGGTWAMSVSANRTPQHLEIPILEALPSEPNRTSVLPEDFDPLTSPMLHLIDAVFCTGAQLDNSDVACLAPGIRFYCFAAGKRFLNAAANQGR